jgi:hypothetical protein
MQIAKQLLTKTGIKLVGKNVITQKMGLWPGGLAIVTELNPDPNAPEIVFNVRHSRTGEEIGVFEDELVVLKEELSA